MRRLLATATLATALCGGEACVNTANDVRNCGECGHVCNLGLGEVCVTGTCMAPGA